VRELNAREAADRRAEMSCFMLTLYFAGRTETDGEGETLSILFSSLIRVRVFAEDGEGGGASAVDIVELLRSSVDGK
jgi:hypothetical protein